MLRLLLNLIAPLFLNLALGVMVFVVLFVTITFLLAREQFTAMLRGLGRIIGSFFYSPFVYLRKAIRGLADYGRQGEKELVRTEQYLLHKLLLTLSAGSILIAVAILSVGMVLGAGQAQQWIAVRKAIKVQQQILETNQADLTSLTRQINQLDSVWTNHREVLLSAYEAERRQKADAARAENQALIKQLSQAAQSDRSILYIFDNMQYYYAS